MAKTSRAAKREVDTVIERLEFLHDSNSQLKLEVPAAKTSNSNTTDQNRRLEFGNARVIPLRRRCFG